MAECKSSTLAEVNSCEGSSTWAFANKASGTGSGTVIINKPAVWTGRNSRFVTRVICLGGNTHTVKITQLGTCKQTITPASISFVAAGGESTVSVTTNVANLTAVITSSSGTPVSVIKSMVVNGVTVDVNNTSVNYGVPGDPGATGAYTALFTIKMPENKNTQAITETLRVGSESQCGVGLVEITQAAADIKTLNLTCPEEKLSGAGGTSSIGVTSDTSYDISVTKCNEAAVVFEIEEKEIILETSGAAKTIALTSSPGITWKTEEAE